VCACNAGSNRAIYQQQNATQPKRLHSLGHALASQLADGGVDVVTDLEPPRPRLRAITLKIYARLLRMEGGAAAGAINAALAHGNKA